MKNTRKIVVALCLILVLASSFAISAFAAAPGTAAITTGSKTAFEDYASVKKIMVTNYEGQSGQYVVNDKTNGVTNVGPANTGGLKSNVAMIVNEAGKGAPYIYDAAGTTSSDYFYKVDYSYNTNGAHVYVQPRSGYLKNVKDDPEKTPLNGYVCEFDIGTPSGNLDAFSVQIFNDAGADAGCLNVFSYSAKDGKATVTGSQEPKASVTATSAGQWIHITVIFTPGGHTNTYATGYISVYANVVSGSDRAGSVSRTCIAQFQNDDVSDSDSKTEGIQPKNVAVYPMQFRIGAKHKSGSFQLDNFLWYQSKSVCNPDYLGTLSDADKFVKYVDLMCNTSVAATKRFSTYETVRDNFIGMFASSSDSTVKAAVTKYNNFVSSSLASVTSAAKIENSTTLKSMVDQLAAKKRGISNIGERQTLLTSIDNFMANTASLIDKDHANYKTAMTNYELWKGYLSEDIDVRTFKNRMAKFTEAEKMHSSGAMQKHYDAANEVYTTVEAVHNGNYANFSSSTEVDEIKAAVTKYKSAGTALATAVQENNSNRFIKLVALFGDTTQTQWAADDGTIQNQWYLARGILLEQNYSSTYSGFSAAKTKYDVVNAYFWKKLQDEHIAILNAKLDSFNAAGASYIDQAGVCTYVDNYLTRNYDDIDWTNTTIVSIQNRNNEYKAQLPGIKTTYAAELVQNTVLFKLKMDEISALTGYDNLKPAFDAATELYYAMNIKGNENVSHEDVLSAVASYEALRIKLKNVEVDSTAFVNTMYKINETADDKDARYAAILTCYQCDEGELDGTYEVSIKQVDKDGNPLVDAEGNPVPDVVKKASEYMSQYESLKSEYETRAAVSTSESTAAVSVMCAARTFCGIEDLVKYVQDLFK